MCRCWRKRGKGVARLRQGVAVGESGDDSGQGGSLGDDFGVIVELE